MTELTHEWVEGPDPVIPEIDDATLFSFNGSFAHLLRQDGSFRHVLHPSTNEALRRTSCIWSPDVGPERTLDGGEQRLVPFYVSCGFYGFFKPSIAEVAACAPIAELQAGGFNAFHIGSHVDLLRSGSYQRATAIFVQVKA